MTPVYVNRPDRLKARFDNPCNENKERYCNRSQYFQPDTSSLLTRIMTVVILNSLRIDPGFFGAADFLNKPPTGLLYRLLIAALFSPAGKPE